MFVTHLLHVSTGALASPVLTIVMLLTKTNSGKLRGKVQRKTKKFHPWLLGFLMHLSLRDYLHRCPLTIRCRISCYSLKLHTSFLLCQLVMEHQISQLMVEVNTLEIIREIDIVMLSLVIGDTVLATWARTSFHVYRSKEQLHLGVCQLIDTVTIHPGLVMNISFPEVILLQQDG